MVFVNCIYDVVVDTQFHKFHGRPFARVLYQVFIPHERCRSVTPLGATRVNRTILHGRAVHNHSADGYYITRKELVLKYE